MTHLSPLLNKRAPSRTNHGQLRHRPGIIIPPPIDATRRLPPIRLPPMTQQPEINSENVFVAPSSPTCSTRLPPLTQKQYPKTPTFQMPEPVSVVAQRCLAHPPFQIVEQIQIDIFHWRKESVARPLIKDLNVILRAVRSKGWRMTLTNGDYNQLIRMICRYIFKPKQRLSIRNPFGESIPVYEITNYAYLEIVHAILQSLLVEPYLINSFIDRKFVSYLIDELDTPVLQEQQNVENEVNQIVEGFPDLSLFTVKSLLSRLMEYIDGYRNSYCVSPILRIMLSFFEKNEPENMDQIYRNYVVPLYYTNYLSDFEKPIRMVTTYFSKRNGYNAQVCLIGLLNHWPTTAPRKEVSFLQQLSLLMQNVPEKSLPTVCPKVLRVMARCIGSEHSGVSLSACFLLMDGQYLLSFASVRELFLVTLVPALRKARTHWKADQQSMADQLLQTLGDDGTIHSDSEKKTAKAKAIWQQLSKKTALPLSKRVVL